MPTDQSHKAAAMGELRVLHKKLANAMNRALDAHDEINNALRTQHDARVAACETDAEREALGEFMPIAAPAATFNAISKFLKDNEVTSSPDDDEDMRQLQDHVRQKQHEGKRRPPQESPLDLSDLPIHTPEQ